MPPVSIDRIPFILDGALAAALPGAKIAFQGEQFEPPKKGIWIRPTCKTGDMEDDEKGDEGWSRRHGDYLVDIFSPWPGSTAEAWRMAAKIEAAFRCKCFDGVQAEDPKTENLGVDKYNKFQVRVSVQFWCWSA